MKKEVCLMFVVLIRFDFVLHANANATENHKSGRDGKKYQHNNGVFKMRFQGLLACEIWGVVSEATLVYSKPGMRRADAEVELAALFVETSSGSGPSTYWPHTHFYNRVNSL